MTSVYKYNNNIIIENGAIGISPSCCCGCVPPCCNYVRWTYTLGGCNNVPEPLVFDNPVDAGSCYSYFVWEDWDCQNPLTGRDCGEGDQCNVYARVKVTCSDRDEDRGGCGINCTLGSIQYRAANNDQWGGDSLADCDCPDAFGSLTAEVCIDEGEVCGAEVTKDILITLTGNISRVIVPGIANCDGPNTFLSSITYITCNNGNYTATLDLDVEVCAGNDPNNTTYCGILEIFYTVNDFDVQITGWNIECGLVSNVQIV